MCSYFLLLLVLIVSMFEHITIFFSSILFKLFVFFVVLFSNVFTYFIFSCLYFHLFCKLLFFIFVFVSIVLFISLFPHVSFFHFILILLLLHCYGIVLICFTFNMF